MLFSKKKVTTLILLVHMKMEVAKEKQHDL